MLDAAEELLEDRSFEHITVDEIARRAGCTKGAFYHRFDDKASLLRHLDGRTFEAALEGWEAFLEPGRWRGRGLREIGEAFVRRLAGIYTRRGHLMRAFVYEARWKGDEEVRARARELNGFVRDRLLALVRERRDGLPAGHGSPASRVDFWLGACTGVLGQVLLFSDLDTGGGEPTPERATDEAVRLLVPYLAGDGRGPTSPGGGPSAGGASG